jgi:hypothetical protein
MFCPDCGHKLEGEEKFCTQCGTPLGDAGAVKKSSPSSLTKIVGIVGAVVVVIVIVALLIGGGAGTSTPEQTIRAFYRAAERLDASRQANLWVEKHRASVAATAQTNYALLDSFSISNLTITITSQTKETAEAIAEYDWNCRWKDGTVDSRKSEVDHFELIRVGNKWFIQETDTNLLF